MDKDIVPTDGSTTFPINEPLPNSTQNNLPVGEPIVLPPKKKVFKYSIFGVIIVLVVIALVATVFQSAQKRLNTALNNTANSTSLSYTGDIDVEFDKELASDLLRKEIGELPPDLPFSFTPTISFVHSKIFGSISRKDGTKKLETHVSVNSDLIPVAGNIGINYFWDGTELYTQIESLPSLPGFNFAPILNKWMKIDGEMTSPSDAEEFKDSFREFLNEIYPENKEHTDTRYSDIEYIETISKLGNEKINGKEAQGYRFTLNAEKALAKFREDEIFKDYIDDAEELSSFMETGTGEVWIYKKEKTVARVTADINAKKNTKNFGIKKVKINLTLDEYNKEPNFPARITTSKAEELIQNFIFSNENLWGWAASLQ